MEILSLNKERFQETALAKLTKRSFQYPLAAVSIFSLTAMIQPVQAAVIGSQQGVDITVNAGDEIVADATDKESGYLYAVQNTDTGTIHLGNNVSISATLPTSRDSVGLDIKGAQSVLEANGLSIHVASQGAAIGIDLSGNKAYVDLGTGSSIMVETESYDLSSGIQIMNASTLVADRLRIETKGYCNSGLFIGAYGNKVDLGNGSIIKTSGYFSHGIDTNIPNGSDSDGNTYINASGLTIETQGDSAYGILASDSMVIDLGTGTSIKTSGSNAVGIGGGNITADGLRIEVDNATGLSASLANIGAGSYISSKRGLAISANLGEQINFIGLEDNRNTLVAGAGVMSAMGGQINLVNTDIIEGTSPEISVGESWGLRAMLGSTITGENITFTGAEGSAGIVAQNDSRIELTGALTVNMIAADRVAISAQDTSGYATSQIDVKGKMLINGSIQADGGLIDMNMATGSSWTGKAASNNANGGFLNIEMDGSRWNVVGSSNLDNLTLNNSTVDLSKSLSTGDYSTLNVVNLSGNGTFILRTDIVGDGNGVNNAGDKLIVTETSSGAHSLTVMNRGSLATTGNEVLTVVETVDGAASFTSTSQVELGGYLYDVRKNGNNWELYSSGVYVPPSDPGADPEPGENSKPPITTTADAGSNFLNVGYLINYAETQTLMQRMGDIRQSGDKGDMWLRGFAGKFDSFASGKLSAFDMSYSGFQIGADKRVSKETPLFIGVFLGETHGSPNYTSGDGTITSSSAGIYGTYMANSGFYLDTLAKYTHIKNNFSVKDSQNAAVSGHGNADGFSLSLEAGQKLRLNKSKNGFYVEPQLQLTYSHQEATRMKASNGLNVDLGSYESLLGRAGTLVCYELAQGDTNVNLYVKTGIVREFEGNAGYRLNGSPEKHSFKGNGWNNGVGVSAQLGKRHTFYLDVDSTTGHQFNQRQINGGYRFSF